MCELYYMLNYTSTKIEERKDRKRGNPQENGYLYSKGGKTRFAWKNLPPYFQFPSLFDGTKLAGNVEELSSARNTLKIFPHYPLPKEQHFSPQVSLDKLPSCGFDIYFPNTKAGSYLAHWVAIPTRPQVFLKVTEEGPRPHTRPHGPSWAASPLSSTQLTGSLQNTYGLRLMNSKDVLSQFKLLVS